MNITSKEHRDCIVIELSGDFDLYSASDFKSYFLSLSQMYDRIIVDLLKVDYIDSSGIGVLLFSFVSTNQTNKDITFCNLRKTVTQVLKLSQLDKFLPISDDINDAVNKLMREERA